MKTFSKYRLIFLGVALSILFSGGGCAIGSFTSDEQLDKGYIDKIQRGKTTKQEILDWLGLPKAIARKGKIIKAPSNAPEKGMEEVDSELLFELFSEKHEIGDHHIIYFYHSSVTQIGNIIIVPLVYVGSGSVNIDRLWILINQKTHRVEDYVFRSSQH